MLFARTVDASISVFCVKCWGWCAGCLLMRRLPLYQAYKTRTHFCLSTGRMGVCASNSALTVSPMVPKLSPYLSTTHRFAPADDRRRRVAVRASSTLCDTTGSTSVIFAAGSFRAQRQHVAPSRRRRLISSSKNKMERSRLPGYASALSLTARSFASVTPINISVVPRSALQSLDS